jgi:hypothetical protein
MRKATFLLSALFGVFSAIGALGALGVPGLVTEASAQSSDFKIVTDRRGPGENGSGADRHEP